MDAVRRHRFSLALLTILFVAGCGSSGKESPSINESLPPPTHSKEIGLQCLSQGNLGCARENFCDLPSDAHAALRCCVSQFLENYFSDNTQALGRMLGYAPANFSEIRGMSREEILKTKALPFGELFLLDQASAPKPKDLVIGWGGILIRDQASTEELAGIQFASAYEPGVSQFPKLPLSQEFLNDLNGHAGSGDARIGDLGTAPAQGIVDNFPILQRSFTALKAFSELKDQPGRIDAYLNWRFSEETQKNVSTVLKAAYLSLTQGSWTAIAESHWELNLSFLAKVEGLPDGQRLDRQADLLTRDASGEIQVNDALLEQWAAPVLRQVLP
ncbi:MAG: hypothetical protein K8R69_01900 [Deltaproteobacteria bacterium]|nr:hypothetical protein [Deltaproteobacteria bacterium]